MSGDDERLKLWLTEQQTDSVSLSLRVDRTLHEEQTPFQHLAVVETEAYGRMLLLDGMVQTSVGDEFIYHEMITHVALCAHPNPRHVAVVGGGDGGAVREALKHPSVERVTLIEIDGQVIEAARRFLPEIAGALVDPRVEVCVEDGLAHMRTHTGVYDVVLVDSTEPVGAAVGLFAQPFYRDIHSALRDEGLLVAQTESPFYNQALITRAYGGIRQVFGNASLYLASIPTYPSGLWSFTVGSKGPDPRQARAVALDCRYYTSELHRAAFTLPAFVARIVQSSAAIVEGES